MKRACRNCQQQIEIKQNSEGAWKPFNLDGSWHKCGYGKSDTNTQPSTAPAPQPQPVQQQQAISKSEINGLSLQMAGIADMLVEINTKLDKLMSHIKGQPSGYTDYEPPTT
jgi:hypothetical protein